MNTTTPPIPPAELADVWRKPDDARWSEAWKTILKIFSNEARKHPLIKWIPKDEREDRILELAHSFWIYLTENPAKLEASRVKGTGALKIESRRFLDCQPAADEGDQRRILRKHLWTKVNKALLEDVRFEKAGRLWSLAELRPRVTSGTVKFRGIQSNVGLPDRDLIKILPLLESRLSPQRPGQTPPLVAQAALPDFLLEALRRSGRPRSSTDLANFVWLNLSPSPDAVFPMAREMAEGEELDRLHTQVAQTSPEAKAIESEWGIHIDPLSSAFLRDLPRRTANVVALHNQGHTFDEIALVIGASRATAHTECQVFERLFAELVENNDLEHVHAQQLLGLILENLRVEFFDDD